MIFTARREISEYAHQTRLGKERRAAIAALVEYALAALLGIAIFALVAHNVAS